MPSPDITLDQSTNALHYMRRKLKDADVYFFFNESSEPLACIATLQTTGKHAELWDPQTAGVTPLKSSKLKTSRKMQLKLKPYQTEIVVIR